MTIPQPVSNGSRYVDSSRISYGFTIQRLRQRVRIALLSLLCSITVLPITSWGNGVQDADKLSRDEIDRTVQQVMEHDDFRSVRRRSEKQSEEKGFLEKTLDWLNEWLKDAFGGSSERSSGSSGISLGFLKGLLYGMIALIIIVVIIIIVIIVRSVDRGKRKIKALDLPVSLDQATGVSVPPGEQAVSAYENRAAQLAAEGNYRGAIRELLLGSMSWIERAGLIRFRKGLTNRDYIRVIWRREPQKKSYYVTASSFELVYFGRRTATQEMYETCLAGFQGAFRETEAKTNTTI